MMPRVWCAIPVYNNAATIVDVARRCRDQLDHVIIIDDGSTDANLAELLKSLDVTVVCHPTNLGKGAALLTAFKFAAENGAEHLITIDGDGQHFPEDIPRFLPLLQPDTILIGSRDEIAGVMPPSSLFGREFSDFWICVETGRMVKDTQSGFRAYPVQHVLDLPLASRHYNLEMEIITRSIWAGLDARSIPIRVFYPDASERVSSFHPFRDNLRISLLHTRLVLRQLLPIPHRRLAQNNTRRLGDGNAGPVGLAVASAVSIVPGIVLWPLGWIPVLYLAIRLHLNKPMVIACLAICMPAFVPKLCVMTGRLFSSSPHLEWFVGSHIIALPFSLVLACLVYFGARWVQR